MQFKRLKNDTGQWRPISCLPVFILLALGAILSEWGLFDPSFDPSSDEMHGGQETIAEPKIDTAPKKFRDVAKTTNTDKIQGYKNLKNCLENPKSCVYPDAQRDVCKPWGHFYDTLYDRWLEPYAHSDSPPMQFLEIGFYRGAGFESYTKFLSNNKGAELHSMELMCESGRDSKSARSHPWFQRLRNTNRLHCGDASSYQFLQETWSTKMKRPDAPPLMVVIDDGSHMYNHMAASLFFWFPRIEPGGILVVEDIQPIDIANKFRTHIVPQVTKDLHWCGTTGGGKLLDDSLCFPTIAPLLQGVHCEMHICVFVRNDKPSREPDQAGSTTPADAFSGAQKCLFGPHKQRKEENG